MFVKDILEIVKVGSLSSLAVADNDSAVIKFIYSGLSELYNRFNLSIKSETIVTNKNMSVYSLKNDDVNLLLSVYNGNGTELKQTDVYESWNYDYKLINYKTFILRQAFDGVLYAVYKASPILIQDKNDKLDIPTAMLNALLTYIAYLGHSTINKDNINEASSYLNTFNMLCRDLENQGYKIPLTTESITLQVKGFV